MKFYIAITSLCIAASSAAPDSKTGAANAKRAPVILKTTAMHTYFGYTGAIHSSSEGHIMRSASQSDQSTLVTFRIPPRHAGKRCAFVLNLDSPTDFARGSQQLDVFTSLMPATADTDSWPPGNLRDQYVGRMHFTSQVMPGLGQWVQDITHPGSSFTCPAGVMAGELVPVGDIDDIYWSSLSSGASIVVLNP